MTPIFAKAATMASLIDLAESTFRNLVASGQLPKPVKIGGNSLWKVESVIEALDNHEKPVNADPLILKMRERLRGEKAQAHG